ncbi:MAG: hypothetical protein H0X51_06910 [Parachlamydiaceae bacterium]|nr:hypothetical protein [Parachlamydiaceae bacterium]
MNTPPVTQHSPVNDFALISLLCPVVPVGLALFGVAFTVSALAQMTLAKYHSAESAPGRLEHLQKRLSDIEKAEKSRKENFEAATQRLQACEADVAKAEKETPGNPAAFNLLQAVLDEDEDEATSNFTTLTVAEQGYVKEWLSLKQEYYANFDRFDAGVHAFLKAREQIEKRKGSFDLSLKEILQAAHILAEGGLTKKYTPVDADECLDSINLLSNENGRLLSEAERDALTSDTDNPLNTPPRKKFEKHQAQLANAKAIEDAAESLRYHLNLLDDERNKSLQEACHLREQARLAVHNAQKSLQDCEKICRQNRNALQHYQIYQESSAGLQAALAILSYGAAASVPGGSIGVLHYDRLKYPMDYQIQQERDKDDKR